MEKIWKFKISQNSYNNKETTLNGILAIKENVELIGKGNDDGGGYSWTGNIENTNIKLFKNYHGGSKIIYDGYIKGNGIQGTYNSPEESGHFVMNYKVII